MITALLLIVFVLLPEFVFACPRHVIHGVDLHLKSSSDLLVTMTVLALIGLALGIWSGKFARYVSGKGLAVISGVAMTGVMALAGQMVWACHGYDLVSPFLKQVHAEQMKYHKLHGFYASSFVDLGVKPASDQYSYFLPSQTLPAKDVRPRDGIDLSKLPEGVSSVATSDRFTVVALSFKEPDRLDIWTLDQKETFREWSIAAFPKNEAAAKAPSGEAEQHTFTELLNEFQSLLMLVSLILGISLGFAYSMRSATRMTPAAL